MPTVDLRTARIICRVRGLGVAPHDNIQAGIKVYGFDIQESVVIKAGVKANWTADIEAGISEIEILPPTNPLAVHIGQGRVLMKWDAPSSNVHHYEIELSFQEAGVYYLAAMHIQDTKYLLSGLPLGQSLYFKICSVHASGLKSIYEKFKRGKIQRPSILMDVRAISGSTIPLSTVFASTDSSGSVVSFASDTLITVV
jgi:hypothetical protein